MNNPQYGVIDAKSSSSEHPWEDLKFIETNDGEANVKVDLSEEKQTIKGFGGALTAAAATAYELLSKEEQKEAMRLLFSSEGLRYKILRLTIGSCDFSSEMYDYCTKDDLSDFDLDYDDQHIVPILREIKSYVQPEILASCWSPLAKWKTNGEKARGGSLKDDCYEKHAAYMAKYAEEMAKRGFPISMMTIQNEPEATQRWESCRYDEKQEGKMAILLHQMLPNTKIYVWDHNRDVIVRRCQNLFADDAVKEAAYGIAYHWYDGNKHEELSKVAAIYPDKPLLFTEGCVELSYLDSQYLENKKANWNSAVRYAKNYINDINNYSTGFIDWNLILDEKGGPNHVGNYCEAPLMLDCHGHLTKAASYYAIHHLSGFVDPGAKVLNVNAQDVIACAIKNPDGTISVVMLNEQEEKNVALSIGNKTYSFLMEKESIVSLRIRLG